MRNEEDYGDIPEDLGPPRGLKPSKKSPFSSPSLRIGIALVVVVVIGVVVLGFWSGEKKVEVESNVGQSSQLRDKVGTEASPAYVAAVQQHNSQRLEEALKTGQAFIPTPVGQAQSYQEEQEEKTAELSPIEAFQRAIAPPPPPPAALPPPVIAPTYQAPVQPTVDVSELSGAMQNQMQTLIQGWTPQPITVIAVANPGADVLSNLSQGGSTPEYSQTPSDETITRLLIPAGGRVYAQLETEANSDVPTPVVARILSGPLTGAKAIGTFQSTDSYLVLEFTLIAKGEKEYQVQAIAVDPQTQLAGLATETDQRYFQRIVLPGAAAFLKGFAKAYSDPGESTTVGDNFATQNRRKQTREEQIAEGVQETADEAASILRQEASQIKPLVRVASGTPVSILFLGSVREELK